jgi:hypothetical protein
MFSAHIKTKAHQKWLLNLNLNKYNYYIETENLKKTVDNQRLIIARLEKELQNKNITIDYFTQKLVSKHNASIGQTVTNLIDFD